MRGASPTRPRYHARMTAVTVTASLGVSALSASVTVSDGTPPCAARQTFSALTLATNSLSDFDNASYTRCASTGSKFVRPVSLRESKRKPSRPAGGGSAKGWGNKEGEPETPQGK